jgi:hypothetical protein
MLKDDNQSSERKRMGENPKIEENVRVESEVSSNGTSVTWSLSTKGGAYNKHSITLNFTRRRRKFETEIDLLKNSFTEAFEQFSERVPTFMEKMAMLERPKTEQKS